MTCSFGVRSGEQLPPGMEGDKNRAIYVDIQDIITQSVARPSMLSGNLAISRFTQLWRPVAPPICSPPLRPLDLFTVEFSARARSFDGACSFPRFSEIAAREHIHRSVTRATTPSPAAAGSSVSHNCACAAIITFCCSPSFLHRFGASLFVAMNLARRG